MRQRAARESDAEFVERIRQQNARYDRLRWKLIVFRVVIAVAAIGLAVAAFLVVRAAAIPFAGFGIGVFLGSSVGLVLAEAIHSLGRAMTDTGRGDRLLVSYYDLVQNGMEH